MSNPPLLFRFITASISRTFDYFMGVFTITNGTIKRKLANLTELLLQKETDHNKLIYSCCVGMYIAISPFICFHTAMVFLFGWLFTLNIPVMFAISCFVNNPFTMIPIYTLDYIIGRWLFMYLGIDGASYNPVWVAYLSSLCEQRLGIAGLSLWPFIVGGNLLAIALAGILYLIIYFFYRAQKTK